MKNFTKQSLSAFSVKTKKKYWRRIHFIIWKPIWTINCRWNRWLPLLNASVIGLSSNEWREKKTPNIPSKSTKCVPNKSRFYVPTFETRHFNTLIMILMLFTLFVGTFIPFEFCAYESRVKVPQQRQNYRFWNCPYFAQFYIRLRLRLRLFNFVLFSEIFIFFSFVLPGDITSYRSCNIRNHLKLKQVDIWLQLKYFRNIPNWRLYRQRWSDKKMNMIRCAEMVKS